MIFRLLWRKRTPTATPPPAGAEAYQRMHAAIRALPARYRITASSCDVSPTGATLVFATRAVREQAERDGTTSRIADDLRALAAKQGLDPATALQRIAFADMDAINAAGGAYNYFR